MAARQKGSFSLGGTLEIKADAPADARLCVKTKSELTDANSFPYKYIGMIVSVADEGKAYILIASDTTVTANWKALGEGGSGGSGGLVEGYFNPSNSLFYKESTYTTPITGSTDMLYLSLDSGKLYYFNRTIFVVVTGDGSGGLVEGYYNPTNHLFYKESTYTTPISGERDKLYLSLDTNKLYYYNGSTFIVIAGEGGGGGTSGLTINATLTAAGWNNSTRRQTLTFAGYESSMGGVIGMPTSATAAQKEAYAESKINVVAQSGTSFTFECESIPSVDLPVTLYAGGGSGGSGSGVPAGGTTGQVLAKKSNTDGDVEWKDVANPTQVSTMPTAAAANLGQIVQFVGTTDTNYTNGLFYECVSDGESTPTYSWEQKDVQSYPEVDLTKVFASGMPSVGLTGSALYPYLWERVSFTTTDTYGNMITKFKQAINNIFTKHPEFDGIFVCVTNIAGGVETYVNRYISKADMDIYIRLQAFRFDIVTPSFIGDQLVITNRTGDTDQWNYIKIGSSGINSAISVLASSAYNGNYDIGYIGLKNT